MEERKNPAVDPDNWPRTDWGAGPWDAEPDREEWRDEDTGLPCIAQRGPSGAWCGYVGVPPGHPFHGLDLLGDLSVHGGITYAEACNEKIGICHVPAPGESDDVWWLGFDCIHWGDCAPAFRYSYDGVYRPLSYVRSEIRGLARQLAEACR